MASVQGECLRVFLLTGRTVLGATHNGHTVTNWFQNGLRTYFDSTDLAGTVVKLLAWSIDILICSLVDTLVRIVGETPQGTLGDISHGIVYVLYVLRSRMANVAHTCTLVSAQFLKRIAYSMCILTLQIEREYARWCKYDN